MKKSVSQQLADYLMKTPGEVASAELQRMIWYNKRGTTATPRSIVRRLEELAEGEKPTLKVSYHNGNAYYKFNDEKRKPKQLVEIKDGVAHISYVSEPVEEVISGLEKW